MYINIQHKVPFVAFHTLLYNFHVMNEMYFGFCNFLYCFNIQRFLGVLVFVSSDKSYFWLWFGLHLSDFKFVLKN